MDFKLFIYIHYAFESHISLVLIVNTFVIINWNIVRLRIVVSSQTSLETSVLLLTTVSSDWVIFLSDVCICGWAHKKYVDLFTGTQFININQRCSQNKKGQFKIALLSTMFHICASSRFEVCVCFRCGFGSWSGIDRDSYDVPMHIYVRAHI